MNLSKRLGMMGVRVTGQLSFSQLTVFFLCTGTMMVHFEAVLNQGLQWEEVEYGGKNFS